MLKRSENKFWRWTSFVLLLAFLTPGFAQPSGNNGSASTAQEIAPVDLSGYWVSVVTEDWKFRMVTPDAGIFDGLTLNAEGQRVGNTWNSEADIAAGLECLAYGAPAIMRLPGRFHFSWVDNNTLQIETDYGTQTRTLHFDSVIPGAPSGQGRSLAEWQMAPGGSGSLKVMTDNLSAGYMRKNGAPHSDQTVVTEYYDIHSMSNGDIWLSITTRVDDPVYFTMPLITTTDFKKLPNNEGWNPTPCMLK